MPGSPQQPAGDAERLRERDRRERLHGVDAEEMRDPMVAIGQRPAGERHDGAHGLADQRTVIGADGTTRLHTLAARES